MCVSGLVCGGERLRLGNDATANREADEGNHDADGNINAKDVETAHGQSRNES